MARRRQGERVLGPYAQDGKWRIIVVGNGGNKTNQYYETKGQALQVIRSLMRLMNGSERTIEEAVKEYETYLRDDKQNKPGSIADTIARIRKFFTEMGDDGSVLRGTEHTLLSSITPERGARLYDALRKQKSARTGRVLSVDSHRNILAETKTFLGWCMERRWISRNPLETVKGTGKRRKGKEQLRIDEARKWFAKAMDLADDGEEGAIAALAALVLGMRASEITTRVVRDLDDEGKLLWIPDAKTEKGKRQLQVPELLRPFLMSLAEGKKSQDLLFGYHDRDWVRGWVQRICKSAGVPTVTAHGMRGLHGTLATESGTTGHVIASQLGHESVKTSYGNYVKPEALANQIQRKALTVLQGQGDKKEAA